MPELDFAGLRSDAEAAARQPEFDAVTHRVQTVRRRRAVVLGGVFLAVVAVTGAVALTAGPPDRKPEPADPPALREPTSLSLGMGDTVEGYGDHLYVLRNGKLMASEDQGRTWQPREAPGVTSFRVLGPDLLVGGAGGFVIPRPPNASPKPTPTRTGYQVSTDGGRTWKALRQSEEPAEVVPTGTRPLSCDGDRCKVLVVDPATGILAELRSQPALDAPGFDPGSVGDGLWMTGFDPATQKPAVASSADRGATWQVTVLDGEAPRPNPATMYRPYVATFDGRTGYAMFVGGGDTRVYRTVDGARTWTRTAANMPGGAFLLGPTSVATADGGHLMAVQTSTSTRYLTSPDGRTYTVVDLPGATGLGAPARFLGPGRLQISDRQHLYLSDDGRTWRAATLP